MASFRGYADTLCLRQAEPAFAAWSQILFLLKEQAFPGFAKEFGYVWITFDRRKSYEKRESTFEFANC